MKQYIIDLIRSILNILTAQPEGESLPPEVKAIPPKIELPKVEVLKSLVYPSAVVPGYEMKTVGRYEKGYPEGAVVHYTAGSTAESSLAWGLKQGYCFYMIAKSGKVYQPFKLDRWGSHCGASSHDILGTRLSKKLVGIEIDNSGSLTSKGGKYYTWFDKEIPAANVRRVEDLDGMVSGNYEKYTSQQEEALTRLLLWLKANNPSVFNFDYVLGHYEVSKGRKADPSGALSVSMARYRSHLKELYSKGGV